MGNFYLSIYQSNLGLSVPIWGGILSAILGQTILWILGVNNFGG